MPTLEIKQSTLQRLQRHAQSYLHDAVINTALDALERQNSIPEAASGEHIYSPNKLPNLSHTKVLDVSIAGESFNQLSWGPILCEVLRRAISRGRTFEDMRKLCHPIKIIKGRKEDGGYKYLPNIDISVQSHSAEPTCRTIFKVAHNIALSMEIGFEWRPKEKASRPGERGRIQTS